MNHKIVYIAFYNPSNHMLVISPNFALGNVLHKKRYRCHLSHFRTNQIFDDCALLDTLPRPGQDFGHVSATKQELEEEVQNPVRTTNFCLRSKIRREDFLCLFVRPPLPPPSRSGYPPLDSETGWTGELWSNRVLLILEN